MAALEYLTRMPAAPKDKAPLVVLLHGRGATADDLTSLSDLLPEGTVSVYPQAPFDAAPWGYGPGYAWYRFLGGARPEPESFSEGQRILAEFLAGIRAELPVRTGPMFVGGFSQGGTSSLAWALGHPGVASGVLVLSGFLAEHPDVAVTPQNARGLNVFWGHGTQDGNIPFALGEAGRAALRRAGAQVTAHDYPMAHSISLEEMQDVKQWMEGLT